MQGRDTNKSSRLGMWRHFIHTFMSHSPYAGIVSDQSDYQCPAITLDFVQPLSIDGIVDDRGAAVGFLIQYPADILADYAKKQKIKRVCK